MRFCRARPNLARILCVARIFSAQICCNFVRERGCKGVNWRPATWYCSLLLFSCFLSLCSLIRAVIGSKNGSRIILIYSLFAELIFFFEHVFNFFFSFLNSENDKIHTKKALHKRILILFTISKIQFCVSNNFYTTNFIYFIF